ncbi:zona pellucida sperm-binding protein 3 isoform X2 [Amia ocellicauda]|uniref:zona pellucida sperm-binding protein 3 isoform X2 n=1 Tax=Amia ocellicauda TaxID=2972642 RepID=UPI003464D903
MHVINITMAFLWGIVVMVVLYCVVIKAQPDVTVECRVDSLSVLVVLKPGSPSPVQSEGLLLGNCLPVVSSDGRTAVFESDLLGCCAMRMATAGSLVYQYTLTYMLVSSTSLKSEPIVCSYTMPVGWAPPLYNPVLGDADGLGTLDFSMEIMMDDFSGPRISSTFFLGSLIPIKAAVDQQFHMPLVLFLEECVTATSANLSASTQTYPLISNYGCFLDSQSSNSKFLPRDQTNEIKLLLQAFTFPNSQDVYIHCQLVAWDPQQPGPTKKACNFNKGNKSWESLETPTQNGLCNCCDSNCNRRRKRAAGMGEIGASALKRSPQNQQV